MSEVELLFALDVLETPLGVRRSGEDSPDETRLADEREKVMDHYDVLRVQGLGMAEASRLARAAWLRDYLAGHP